MPSLRALLREPLIPMLGFGIAVFAVHRWVSPPNPREIVLTPAMRAGLRQDHLRRTGTLPAAAEEQALVDRFLDDEVLYREALRLGLDRGDIIVRRRLVQKMEFITEDTDAVAEPTDAELTAHLAAHAARFAQPSRVSLFHVFAGRDGGAPEAVVAKWRAALERGVDPAALGQPFVRGRDFRAQSEVDLAGIFGASFAAQVMAAPEGVWSGPIASSYGTHLVRIAARTPAMLPDLPQVREAVRRDWLEAARVRARRAGIEELRRAYTIRTDDAADPGGAQAATSP